MSRLTWPATQQDRPNATILSHESCFPCFHVTCASMCFLSPFLGGLSAQALAAQRASAERERQAGACAACKEAGSNTRLTGQVKASAQRVAGELQRELSIEEAHVQAVN